MIMGAMFIANSVFGINLGFTEAQVSAVIGVLTPILVYLIPNKKTV
jgi:glucose uptake protein GlcU